MAVQYVNPDEMIHPLRLTMSEEEIGEIFQGIADDADWMSLEEIEAAQDWLYDYIAADKQTHEGVTTLQ
jgi:hypothetical protein